MPKDAPAPPDSPIRRVDKLWKTLVPVATLIMGTIGNFWVPPPPGPAGEVEGSDRIFFYFAQFVIAILLGLMVLPMMKWCCLKRHAWFWGKVAAAVLVAGIVAFFSYQNLLGDWTVVHDGRRMYVGSEVKPEVAEFVRRHLSMSKSELLENAGWDPRLIWTENSLARRRLVLAVFYVLCAPLFAVAIVSVAQIVYCSSSAK